MFAGSVASRRTHPPPPCAGVREEEGEGRGRQAAGRGQGRPGGGAARDGDGKAKPQRMGREEERSEQTRHRAVQGGTERLWQSRKGQGKGWCYGITGKLAARPRSNGEVVSGTRKPTANRGPVLPIYWLRGEELPTRALTTDNRTTLS